MTFNSNGINRYKQRIDKLCGNIKNNGNIIYPFLHSLYKFDSITNFKVIYKILDMKKYHIKISKKMLN